MKGNVDLHNHTTASDGTYTPREAVGLAHTLGLAAIAITDHDTAAGVPEAMAAGAALGVEVIPGVEMNAQYRDKGVHIVGLFIDPAAESVRAAMDFAVRARDARNEKIVAAMAADGFSITVEGLRQAYPGAVLGRPHIAQWLMDSGFAPSVDDAFRQYLGKRGRYYIPRERMALPEAVKAIRQAGGLAVAAHPLQYGYEGADLEAFLRAAKDAGCGAMEVWYPGYTEAQRAMLLDLSDRLGLTPSGGSDFHGARKPLIHMGTGKDGDLAVPYEVLEGLRAAREANLLQRP